MDVSEREKERELFNSRAGSNSKKERKKKARFLLCSCVGLELSVPPQSVVDVDPPCRDERGGVRRAEPQEERRKRRNIRPFGGSFAVGSPPPPPPPPVLLHLSFDTALWRSFRDASTLRGSIATPDLCLRPLEAESTGGERGSTRAKAALATVFHFIYFRSLSRWARWPSRALSRHASFLVVLASPASRSRLSQIFSLAGKRAREEENSAVQQRLRISLREKKGGEEGQATAFSKKTSSRPRPHSSKK